jgi:hypothetical protein
MAHPFGMYGSTVTLRELKVLLFERFGISVQRLNGPMVAEDGDGKPVNPAPVEFFERTMKDGTTKRVAITPGMTDDSLLSTLQIFLLGHNLDVGLEELGYGRIWQEAYIDALEMDAERSEQLRNSIDDD